MTPPVGLVTALRAYDADLRVRWASRSQTWFIERKCDPRVGHELKVRPTPYRSAKGLDRAEAWPEFDHILTVPTSDAENVPYVMDALADADAWRQGGWKTVNRKLDEREEARRKDADRDIDNYMQAAARDAADRAAWLDGRRVSLADDPQPRTKRHEDGFLIRDRRVVA